MTAISPSLSGASLASLRESNPPPRVNTELLRLYETHNTSYRDDRGQTLLHLAVEMRDMAWVTFLLSIGCTPLTGSNCGNTPLHSAAQKNYPEMIHALATKIKTLGGNIDTKNAADTTPLQLAALNNNKEAMVALLAEGADLHQAKGTSRSPLNLAIINSAPDSAKFLIEQNVDTLSKDEKGNTPLHYAAENGDAITAALLLSKNPPISANLEGYNPAHLAAIKGHTAILDLFTRHRICLDEEMYSGKTPIYLAAENGHEATCEYLLSIGLDVRIDPRYKIPSLLDVIIKKNLSHFASVFIPLKIDLTKINAEGYSPLRYACEQERTSIAKLLIKHGGILAIEVEEILDLVLHNDNLEILQEIERHNSTLLSTIFSSSETVYSQAYLYCSKKILAYLRPDPYSRFIIEAKHLAALSGIEGTISHEGKTLDLEGSYMYSYYNICSQSIPDPFPDLKKAFLKASTIHREQDEALTLFSSGKTIVIPAGWDMHAISIVIQGDIMIICNRGEGDILTATMQAFVIDPSKLTKETLKEIIKNTTFTKAKAERFLYVDLPCSLRSSKAGAVAKRLEIQSLLDTIVPKKQHTGNCCAASAKAAIRAALFIEMYKCPPADRSMEDVKKLSKLITADLRKRAEIKCSALAVELPKFAKPLTHLVTVSKFKNQVKAALSSLKAPAAAAAPVAATA